MDRGTIYKIWTESRDRVLTMKWPKVEITAGIHQKLTKTLKRKCWVLRGPGRAAESFEVTLGVYKATHTCKHKATCVSRKDLRGL